MKTKNLILFFILLQFAFTPRANACGSFFLKPTASYFDYSNRTGRVVVSVETSSKDEARWVTLTGWKTTCGPFYPQGGMNFEMYLSNQVTLSSSAILVATVSNVPQNYTNSYTVSTADGLFRTTYDRTWNDVSLNYTLPSSISNCAYSSTYRYTIVKCIYPEDNTQTSNAPITNPQLGTPFFTTTTTKYCLTSVNSAQICINPVPTAMSYNWIYPSGWSGPATSTSTCITVNFNGVAQTGNICCTANFSCGSQTSSCLSVTTHASLPTDAGVYWEPPTVQSTPTPAKKNVTVYLGTYYWSVSLSQIGSNGLYQSSLIRSNEADANPSGYPVSVIMKNSDILTVNAYNKNSCGRSEGVGKGYKMVNGQLQPYELFRMNTAIEPVAEQAVTIFPNPASSSITVQIENVPANYKITMYNVIGKKVKESVRMERDKTEMNVSDLENGIYFLQVENENVIVRKEKVIVAH